MLGILSRVDTCTCIVGKKELYVELARNLLHSENTKVVVNNSLEYTSNYNNKIINNT